MSVSVRVAAVDHEIFTCRSPELLPRKANSAEVLQGWCGFSAVRHEGLLFGFLKGISKSTQVLLNGIGAVMVLTLIGLK